MERGLVTRRSPLSVPLRLCVKRQSVSRGRLGDRRGAQCLVEVRDSSASSMPREMRTNPSRMPLAASRSVDIPACEV
jgi:hypothetical protein